MNNLELFEKCLEIGESIIDPYYFNGIESLFIDDINVISQVSKLRTFITTCCVNINKNISFDYLLDDILDILEKNVQYSEFVSFRKVLDISYSSFSILDQNQKKEVLKNFIYLYCENRENKYIEKGILYSNSTIQSLYDTGSSRNKGESGKKKLLDFFKEKGISNYFVDEQKIKNEIINKHLNFEFSHKYQGKMPDAIFYKDDKIFILEAKHINESGGAQDKQIHELIDFISFGEDQVSYISFLDGTYFNKFKKPKKSSKKILSQKEQIIEKLKKNKNNYFVNTYGLNLLF